MLSNVCASLCTTVVHNTAQNSSDKLEFHGTHTDTDTNTDIRDAPIV